MKKRLLTLLLVIAIIVLQGQIIYATDYEYESEPNDTMATADSYSVYDDSTYVYGTINDFDDTDYFKLKATFSGIMDIHFYFDYDTSSSDINIDFYLYDSSENRLEYIADSNGSESFDISVSEGDYVYARIDHDAGYLSEPYRLRFDMD